MTTTAVQTIRYIFKCRRDCCQHVFAFDYVLDAEQREGNAARTLEDGTVVYLVEDLNNGLRCPACRGYHPKATRVNGHYNEKHTCNARCMTATSGVCDCQCNGKNHGASHL